MKGLALCMVVILVVWGATAFWAAREIAKIAQMTP
jgi:hypothetical protein